MVPKVIQVSAPSPWSVDVFAGMVLAATLSVATATSKSGAATWVLVVLKVTSTLYVVLVTRPVGEILTAGTGTFVVQIEMFVATSPDAEATRLLFLLVFHLPLTSVQAGVLSVPSALRLSTITGPAARPDRELNASTVVRVRAWIWSIGFIGRVMNALNLSPDEPPSWTSV